MKTRTLIVRITEAQETDLQAKARAAGFIKKSDYVRYVLFMPDNLSEMIRRIHDKVVNQ